MDYSKDLEDFSPRLKDILQREINQGNKIAETSRGWPNPTSVFVCLEFEFVTPIKKNEQGIEYREINDPDYWKAEYFDPARDHTLACKYD
jgi:hypothetical protein